MPGRISGHDPKFKILEMDQTGRDVTAKEENITIMHISALITLLSRSRFPNSPMGGRNVGRIQRYSERNGPIQRPKFYYTRILSETANEQDGR